MAGADPLSSVPDPSADASLSDGERAALLAEADGLATGTEAERDRAEEMYWRLQGWLDPRRDTDVARVDFLIRGDRAALEPLLRRVVEQTPDTTLGEKALVALGAVVDRAGRGVEAEPIYRSALARLKGRGDDNELAALVNVARYFRMAERHPEALLAARCAEALALARSNGWAVALTRSYVCGSLLSLEDYPRAHAALERLAQATAASPASRQPLLSISLHGYRSVLRLHEGDGAGALAEADAMAAAGDRAQSATSIRRWAHLRRARALFALGRRDESAAAIDHARAEVDLLDSYHVDVEVCAIEHALALRDHVAAIDAALRILESIENAGPALGTGTRLVQAARLGRLLAAVEGGERAARRAYGVAGAAALVRIVEVDRALADFPDLSEPTAEDLAILNDHRQRMQDEQDALLEAVARLLVPAIRGGEPSLADLVRPGDFVAVCAWCRRVRVAGERWLPVQTYVPERAPFHFTHTICPPCRDRVLA